MPQVLLTGLSGFIGQYLWQAKPKNVDLIGTVRQPQNWKISSTNILNSIIPFFLEKEICRQIQGIQPDIVIHTAAMAKLGACEQNPDLAFRVNARATAELAEWCRVNKARLIYLSTDIVFKGDRAPYIESCQPQPINVYGKSKLAGERAVQDETLNYAIARIALALGRGLGNKENFIDWFLNKINTGQEATLFHDEIRTPTAIRALVENLWRIALSSEQGIFHLCGLQSIDRYELGKSICDILGKGSELLKPVSLKDMSDYQRPVDVSLQSTRTVEGEKLEIPGIEHFLKNIISE